MCSGKEKVISQYACCYRTILQNEWRKNFCLGLEYGEGLMGTRVLRVKWALTRHKRRREGFKHEPNHFRCHLTLPGCHKKKYQTLGSLNNRILFTQVWNQSARMTRFLQDLSSYLTGCHYQLAMCMVFPWHGQEENENKISYKGTNPIMGPHPHDLIST